MRGVFYVLAACALLAAILLIPARIRLTAALTLSGGYGEARISWLCFTARFPMRLYLLRGKRLHLDILRRDGRIRKRVNLAGKKPPKKHWPNALVFIRMVSRIDASMLLGIEDAPAATALVSCAAESLASNAVRLLLPDAKSRVRAAPLFAKNALRVELVGIARVYLGKIIAYRIRTRGE